MWFHNLLLLSLLWIAVCGGWKLRPSLHMSALDHSPQHAQSLNGQKVLILQNQGGGHGALGYYLSKELRARSQSVDIVLLQDKCDMNQEPFRSYEDLRAQNVVVIDQNLRQNQEEIKSLLDGIGDFDYVIDNWSKRAADCEIVSAITKKAKAKQLLYISSAGMYKSNHAEIPLLEDDEVIPSNEAVKIEQLYRQQQDFPSTFFRPQYLFGEKANKRYLDYFAARAYRKLPIFLPSNGDQLISLTHHVEAAQMIISAIGDKPALNSVFNCVSDKYITTMGLCELIHDALETSASERQYLFYDPQEFTHWSKMNWPVTPVSDFPFRFDSFVAGNLKSKGLPNLRKNRNLTDDVKAMVEEYIHSAAATEEWTMEDLRKDFDVS